MKRARRRAPATTAYLAVFTLVAIGVVILAPPTAQPLAYHAFADGRTYLGVANFLDVVSNAAFLGAGLAGLRITLDARTAFGVSAERWPYATFFVGLVLTAFGSAWYHLQPDNERLFWDRLPMTVAFMSLVAAQIGDRFDARTGTRALLPLLAIGAATVMYWRATERSGAGNLVPYGVLQLWALGVLTILLLRPSRYSHGNAVLGVLATYLVAKLCEHLDAAIFDAVKIVSGHTLKHCVAAIGGIVVARMLHLRSPRVAAKPLHVETMQPLATSRPR